MHFREVVCRLRPLALVTASAVVLLLLLVSGGAKVGDFAAVSSPAVTEVAGDRYVIDAPASKFMARAHAGGLLWFKGHDHHLAAREFSGEVEITPGVIVPASMRLVVKAGSLAETSAAFTDQQKQIINKELHDIVLHPDQYPEIIFQSTSVTSRPAANGQFDVKIIGNLTLHGVTRPETIEAKVTVKDNDLRAVGEFSIDRDDYKVKATSAFHGLVRVRNNVTFEFDIVSHRA
jgi:polyisoprenoid-binding protein YceI